MLTKDLVRYQTKGVRIAPEFLDPTQPALLEAAAHLLDCFKAGVGETRASLEERVDAVLEGQRVPPLIGRGLVKLLFDRTEFDTGVDEDASVFRADLFALTSRLLRDREFASVEDYQAAAGQAVGQGHDEISARLYADLPENQPAKDFRSLSPERLLHRYNCALVQWLLLHAHTLEITLENPDAGRSRGLLRQMRFHQLMAKVQPTPDGAVKILVDGPLNLFAKTKKYGLQLANFFPALLHQPSWRLEAEVAAGRGRPKILALDQSCGLRPYAGGALGYVPPEVEMFQELFAAKSQDWRIAPAEEFIALPKGGYCFPDFTLTHASTGASVGMELFHAWHAAQLASRLDHVGALREPLLLIGVAQKLAKTEETAKALAESDYFARYGFVFREMPSLDDVAPALAEALKKGNR